MRFFAEQRRPVHWTDRTLTILRANRLEACEKEFAGLGGCGLFDEEATDRDAERLFGQSYFAEEEKEPRLHTLDELRLRVLSQFPAEVGLVSEEEFSLLVKLTLFGGEMPLYDWNDLPAAVSLIRRMWCRARPENGNWIVLSRRIAMAALLMLSSEEMKKVRDIAADVLDTVDNTLYLAGMMPAEIVVRDLGYQLQGSLSADKEDLYVRLLKSSFETMKNRQGRLILVHPGLAEPRGMEQTEGGLHAGLKQGARAQPHAFGNTARGARNE